MSAEKVLSEFKYEETLSDDPTLKQTALLGRFEGQPCVVILTRNHIPPVVSTPGGRLPVEHFKCLDSNDVFTWGLVEVPGGAKVDIINPASEYLIEKHRSKPKRVVTETPDLYKRVVKPYIATMHDSHDWVRQILYHGAEADSVLYRDDDFVLIPNWKWDRKTMSALYLLAIVKRDDLASIRDLKSDDIPFLEHTKNQILKVVGKKYGLEPSQVKLYFHYQPSYYHLHIHVAYVGLEQSDFGRSILFDNVLDIVRMQGMEHATLSYIVSEGHKLWQLLNTNGQYHH